MYWASILALFIGASCGNDTKTSTEEPTTDTETVELESPEKDVITTASGLSYTYITRGTGKEIQTGSEVSSYLSLLVNGEVVWDTQELPDQLFVFKAGDANLIEGFNEMALLLREGDEVSVTMPPSIAYGETGTAGFVPPNTPITYAPFRVVKVSDPVEAAPINDSTQAQ